MDIAPAQLNCSRRAWVLLERLRLWVGCTCKQRTPRISIGTHEVGARLPSKRTPRNTRDRMSSSWVVWLSVFHRSITSWTYDFLAQVASHASMSRAVLGWMWLWLRHKLIDRHFWLDSGRAHYRMVVPSDRRHPWSIDYIWESLHACPMGRVRVISGVWLRFEGLHRWCGLKQIPLIVAWTHLSRMFDIFGSLIECVTETSYVRATSLLWGILLVYSFLWSLLSSNI